MDPFYMLCKFVPEAQRTSASFSFSYGVVKNLLLGALCTQILSWSLLNRDNYPPPLLPGPSAFFLPAAVAQALVNYSPNRTFPKGQTAAQEYF